MMLVADHAEVRAVAELVVELGGDRLVLLGREGLIAVRALVVAVEPEMGLVVQEGAGVNIAQNLLRVKGAVGHFAAHMRLVAELGREEVNVPPKFEVPVSDAVPGLRSKSTWPIAAAGT